MFYNNFQPLTKLNVSWKNTENSNVETFPKKFGKGFTLKIAPPVIPNLEYWIKF